MQRHKKLTARLLSLVLSIVMVTTMTSATVFADDGGTALGVSFTNLTANGEENTTDTTELTLTFAPGVSDLTADDITVTGATKGTLTKVAGQTGQYTLAISNITVAEGANVNVAVAKTGFTFNPTNMDVAVHKAASNVCAIGDTGYATLAEAVTAAAASGDTIKILEDIDLGNTGVTIAGDKSVTLDLNGKTVTYNTTASDSGAITLSNSASLTVTDSTADKLGTLSASGNANAIHNTSTGTLTIAGGTVSGTGSKSTIYNKLTGPIIVSGGTVSASGTNNSSWAIVNQNKGKITITGGTVTSTCKASDGGGTIMLNSVPTSGDKVVLDIQGGTVSNTAVTGRQWAVYFYRGVTSINVGDYYSEAEDATVGNVYPNKPAACAIGTTVYNSLQAAVDAANTGDTIKVLQDISVTGGDDVYAMQINNKSVTVDLNGKTVTYTGNAAYNYEAVVLEGTGSLTVTDSTTGKLGKLEGVAAHTITIRGSGTLTVAGGTVSATTDSAIEIDAGEGSTIEISGDDTVVTSAATDEGTSTIYVSGYPATPGTVLTISGGASVTNTATPDEGYSVYFYDASTNTPTITSANLDTYYTQTTTGTVGKVFPAPAACGITVTVDGKASSGATLAAAITASGVAANSVATLTIKAGKVTEDDWKYLSNLGSMSTFMILDAVSEVADIPAGSVGEPTFPVSIVSVTVPQAVTIGENAFTGCELLTTASFPAATEIGKSAFNGCRLLTTASFPAATSIGKSAFTSCVALTTVSFPAATTIGESAFNSCLALTSATFPEVTSIGDQAFQNCTKLDSVSFPVAISIGGRAFLDCELLTTASFPAVTSIGYRAFQSCKLESVSFPAATSIGKEAFLGCTVLTSATFPKVSSIGENAFLDCALATLKLGATPPTTVGTDAFKNCPDTRALGYVGADGNDLTGTALTNAQAAYIGDSTAGAVADGKWYGWTIGAAAPTHKPVTNITGVPTTAVAGTDLPLTGTVAPADATNKTIVWSVKDAGATGATIVGGKLKTTAAGTVVVTATIANGLTASSAYTKDFTITVNPVGTVLYTITFNANGGSVSPATATTDAAGKLSGLPTPTRSGYTFNGWFTAASGGTAVTTTTVFTQDSTVYAQWTQNSGGGGGGSSSPAPSNTIYSNEGSKGASNVISQAIKNAIATGGTNVSTSATFNNFDFLALDGLKTINEIAAKESAGKTVNFTVNFDAGPKEPVNSRITVNPAALAKELTAKNITGTLPLGVWFDQTKDTKVQSVNTLFGKHFSNKIVSVVYDRNSTLAVNAEFCAKLNLAKTFGTDKNLYFYTYDNTTNIYKRILLPNYRVDKNGYAHITAPFGGSIIISDKPLTKR